MIKAADINDRDILERTVLETHETNGNLVRFKCPWPGLEEPITSDYGAADDLKKNVLKWVEGVRNSVVAQLNEIEEERLAKARRDREMADKSIPDVPSKQELYPESKPANATAMPVSAEGFARQQLDAARARIRVLQRAVDELLDVRQEEQRWIAIVASFEAQKNTPATGEDSEGEVPRLSDASGGSIGE